MSKHSETQRKIEPLSKASDFGPGFTATFLYYFTSAAILTALVAARGLNVSLASGVPQQLGLIVGLLAGWAGGYFNRTVELSVVLPKRRALGQVEEALGEMGYGLAESAQWDEGNPVRIYQRSPLRQLLSGRIYLQQADSQITVAGRAGHLRDLRRRLSEANAK
ncbi:MAG: hypothetical protein ACFB4J_19155 [Elainellaceae cyanobacterium]